MSSEREGYRENYEMLLDMFPGKVVLSKQEVAKAFGIDARTAAKRYQIGKENSISLATLARYLSR